MTQIIMGYGRLRQTLQQLSQVNKKSKRIYIASFIGGAGLLVVPLLVSAGSSYENNELVVEGISDTKSKIDNSALHESEKTHSSSTASDSTDSNSSSSSVGAGTTVKVKSSVTSSSTPENNVSQTTIEHSTDGKETKKETVTRESGDGQSKVRFSFDVNADADTEVKVRERGGRTKIDISQKSEN